MARPPVALPPDVARWLRVGVALVAALILLQVLWELLLAPVRPGGSWLALKALPLALAWAPLARGSPRARFVVLLLLLPCFAEAMTRTVAESGRHALVAGMAAALTAAAFFALLLSFRAAKRHRLGAARRPPDSVSDL
jgi:uncharacterized membrane protein